MVRVPLEELVLQIHLLALGPAGAFLQTVLQPPPAAAVEAALKTLRSVGALAADEQLTPLGRKAPKENLSGFPMSVHGPSRAGAVMVLGCVPNIEHQVYSFLQAVT